MRVLPLREAKKPEAAVSSAAKRAKASARKGDESNRNKEVYPPPLTHFEVASRIALAIENEFG